jgi:hypothetical protein
VILRNPHPQPAFLNRQPNAPHFNAMWFLNPTVSIYIYLMSLCSRMTSCAPTQ